MKILNTLKLLPIFLIVLFQPPNTNEVLIGQPVIPLQPLAAYPFTLLPNVVPSDFASAFVSTISQEINDKSLLVPLSQLKKTSDDIQQKFLNQTFKEDLILGNADPALDANWVLKFTKTFSMPDKNYELEIAASTYAIAQFLEDQGSFPDMTTAFEKAHEYVQTLELYVNELPPDHSWADYYGALCSGSFAFLRSNGLTSYDNLKFIRKIFFDQLPIAMK